VEKSQRPNTWGFRAPPNVTRSRAAVIRVAGPALPLPSAGRPRRPGNVPTRLLGEAIPANQVIGTAIRDGSGARTEQSEEQPAITDPTGCATGGVLRHLMFRSSPGCRRACAALSATPPDHGRGGPEGGCRARQGWIPPRLCQQRGPVGKAFPACTGTRGADRSRAAATREFAVRAVRGQSPDVRLAAFRARRTPPLAECDRPRRSEAGFPTSTSPGRITPIAFGTSGDSGRAAEVRPFGVTRWACRACLMWPMRGGKNIDVAYFETADYALRTAGGGKLRRPPDHWVDVTARTTGRTCAWGAFAIKN
jgi:hypothetical protein